MSRLEELWAWQQQKKSKDSATTTHNKRVTNTRNLSSKAGPSRIAPSARPVRSIVRTTQTSSSTKSSKMVSIKAQPTEPGPSKTAMTKIAKISSTQESRLKKKTGISPKLAVRPIHNTKTRETTTANTSIGKPAYRIPGTDRSYMKLTTAAQKRKEEAEKTIHAKKLQESRIPKIPKKDGLTRIGKPVLGRFRSSNMKAPAAGVKEDVKMKTAKKRKMSPTSASQDEKPKNGSKKRRINTETVVKSTLNLTAECAMETAEQPASPEVSDADDQVFSSPLCVIPAPEAANKPSFAPASYSFEFTKPLTPKLLRFPSSTTSGTPCSLPSITEDGSPMKHSQMNRTSALPTGEITHGERSKVLKNKLLAAVSPDAKLQVLAQSPGITMSRRKPSCRSSPAPAFDIDPPEEDISKVQSAHAEPQLCDAGIEAPLTDEMKNAEPLSTVTPTTKLTDVKPAEDVKDVAYFRNLVIENTNKLEDNAAKWEEINQSLTDVSEDVNGDIRTTVCQARLVIAERFSQFSGLIDQCETNSGERKVLCEDLNGFWDMIFFQVQDVMKKFADLSERQSANWPVIESEIKPKLAKKKIKKKASKPSASSKFAQFKAAMKNKKIESTTDEPVSDVQLLTENPVETRRSSRRLSRAVAVVKPLQSAADVTEPSAPEVSALATPGRQRYSFRRSTLMSSAQKNDASLMVGASAADASISYSTKKSKKQVSFIADSPMTTAKEIFSPVDQTHHPVKQHRLTPYKRQRYHENSENHSVLSDYLPMSMNDDGHKSLPLQNRSLNELTSSYLSENSFHKRLSLVRPQRSCSPSPNMINAILSASKSGKRRMSTIRAESDSSDPNGSLSQYLPKDGTKSTTLGNVSVKKQRDSLHKSLLRRSVRKIQRDLLTSDVSPVSMVNKLCLNDSLESLPGDLMVFSPLVSTPAEKGPNAGITPRRSVRRTRKISLL